jgi:uncharacterized protein (UPF0276 family)
MSTIQGFGLGLRPEHYGDFEASLPAGVDWLEILSENYLVPGGAPLKHLDLIRRDYPMVMHGVSMNIGSSDPLDFDYLRDLKSLAQRIEPAWVSDHLCWTGVNGLNMHDLLPVPYSVESLAHIAERIRRVQDFLARPLVIENPSTYVAFAANTLTEWDFLAELASLTGCELLLDVNNVYVSSVNHGFDARRYIDALPVPAIRQIHLAGHQVQDAYLVDTHDQPVCQPVWDLYAYAMQVCGPVPTMIERDDNIPALSELVAELGIARRVQIHALKSAMELTA